MSSDTVGISHIAIGVTDLEESIAFYRDVLGLTVSLQDEEVGTGLAPFHRHAAYLRWKNGPATGFIVLDRHIGQEPFGKPAEIFQLGFHHIAFSVTSVAAVLEKARKLGAHIIHEGSAVGGRAYGYPVAKEAPPMVITAFLNDPDGNIIQIDEWIDKSETRERSRS